MRTHPSSPDGQLIYGCPSTKTRVIASHGTTLRHFSGVHPAKLTSSMGQNPFSRLAPTMKRPWLKTHQGFFKNASLTSACRRRGYETPDFGVIVCSDLCI